MQKDYLFVHGKNTDLSQHELKSFFSKELIGGNIKISLIRTERKIDQSVMDRLGGTVKICEVFDEDPVGLIEKNSKTEKILFGISQYGGHEKLSGVLLGIKKKLKERGHNARFLNKDYKEISSGQLNKSGIMKKGVDLVRTFFGGKEIWARTIAFQNIDAYSKRDYEKPKRDMKVGMMPPKLAQMMINYAKPEAPTPDPL